jgi:Tfp pilus assembly protein PilO
MSDRSQVFATLLVLALVACVGWLFYRNATAEERHDRQRADCQMRARLERSYSDALYLCLTDRYGWRQIDASIEQAHAASQEIVGARRR